MKGDTFSTARAAQVINIIKSLRLLRASRVKLVKWRTIAVLGRRYRKNARQYLDQFHESITGSPRAATRKGDLGEAHFQTAQPTEALRRCSSRDRIDPDALLDQTDGDSETDGAAEVRKRDVSRALRRRAQRPKHLRSFSE